MSQPAHQRISDDLRRQITEGTLAPGDRVPSRNELCEQYGVSDRVAIQGVQTLVSEGLLEARPGSGTYVRRRPQLKRLARYWYGESGRNTSPFRAEMERQGHVGSWRVASESSRADEEIAARLGITVGDGVMQTGYIFLADGAPVMLSTSWEPLELTRGTPILLPEEGPHAGAGVVARMRAIGQHVETVAEIITARPVRSAEAERLGEPLGSIVMVIKRTYHTATRPVETADIIVPTDQYELGYVMPVE